MKHLRAVLPLALFLATFSFTSAQDLEIDLVNATINGGAVCELTIDEATDILGRPSAVKPPVIEALGDEIFYHNLGLHLQFNSATIDPEKRLLFINIYFAETYDEDRAELYQAYLGSLIPAVDANFKVEKTQSLLDQEGISYIVVTPDEHRQELENLGLDSDPTRPQFWTVRHEGEAAYANFQHEELTQFLETVSIACGNE